MSNQIIEEIAVELDLEVEQGSDFALEIVISENDVPVNVSGRAYVAQIKLDPSDCDPITAFTYEIPDQSIEDDLGHVILTLPAEMIEKIPFSQNGYAYYDVLERNESAQRTSILFGKIYPKRRNSRIAP